MAEGHAKYGASTADRYMACPGSIVLAEGAPRSTSKYAAEGTAAHQVLTWALQEGRPAAAYVGRLIDVDSWTFEVDEEMARHVQVCVDHVHALQGDDGILWVDEQVNYSSYIDVPEDQGWGTLDASALRGTELGVCDFKYGMGVEVDVTDNRQLKLYALGKLRELRAAGLEVDRVRLSISQPRTNPKPSEWDISVEELETWGYGEARSAVSSCRIAEQTYPDASQGGDAGWAKTFLRPGEKQCRFCPAKATCSALRQDVAATVAGTTPATPEEFESLAPLSVGDAGMNADVQWVAACLAKVDLIEDWCKAVRAEAERRLLAGEPVPGFKLVQGKRGPRQWADATDAEAQLKAMRLKVEEMYDLKLISPTSAEKLVKAEKIGPRQWKKLQGLITQTDGKAHVAPAEDPRPPIDVRPVEEEFEVQADDIC